MKLLVREDVRRNSAPLAASALVLIFGVGAGLTSIEVAHRTERAYPDYLRSAEVGDLVVNPSVSTAVAEMAIRSAPGVRRVTSDSLLTVQLADRRSNYVVGRMSTDGRYLTQDQPAVHEGRMIESGREIFVSKETADEAGLVVGDTVMLTFYSPQFTTGDGEVTPEVRLGTEDVRVVGIGVLPDEVLPDELYPRQRILVSPAVAAEYDCIFETPDQLDPRPLAEILPDLFPSDCTTSYRYFSIQAEGGAEGAKAVAEAIAERFGELNEQLPAAFRENNIGYEAIVSFTAEDARRVDQSLSPVVTALRGFGIVAGFTTVGVVLLLVVRMLHRRERDVGVWHSLGMSTRRRTIALAVPAAGALVVGVVGSLLVAWLASSIGPIASARAVVPHRSRGLSSAVLVPLVGWVVVFGLGLASVGPPDLGPSVGSFGRYAIAAAPSRWPGPVTIVRARCAGSHEQPWCRRAPGRFDGRGGRGGGNCGVQRERGPSRSNAGALRLVVRDGCARQLRLRPDEPRCRRVDPRSSRSRAVGHRRHLRWNVGQRPIGTVHRVAGGIRRVDRTIDDHLRSTPAGGR